MRRQTLCGALVLLLAAGCSQPPAGQSYPEGCAAFGLSPHRCEAIIDNLAIQAGVDRAQVASIELLGDDDTECVKDSYVLCVRTTAFVVRARFHLNDGRAVEEIQACGVGGEFSILCTDRPLIRVSNPIEGGYHDIPCAGETPDSCATPVPTIDPAAAAHAIALEIDQLDVPLDHVGGYDIELGQAVLANGVLRETSLALADESPSAFAVTMDGVRMAIESLEADGRPFDNIYHHGWRPDPERVSVRLVFKITGFEEGAVLEIRDVVVR